jgi:hypothetical protein
MSVIELRSEVPIVASESVALRRRVGIRAKVFMLLLSCVATFLVGEATLRLGFLTDHLEFETDEVLLWRNRPNQVVALDVPQSGRPPRLMTTDSRGFRRTFPAATHEGKRRRLLVLGDSAAFGALVADDETFCSQLQALAPDELEVMNAGVGGWGLFQEEMLLSRMIDTIKPHIVLVHHQVFDVLRQPFPPGQKEVFLWESRIKNAVRHYSKLASLIGRLAQSVALGRVGRGVANQVVEQPSGPSDGPSEAYRNCWNMDRERFLRMKNLADRHGAKLVLVYTPHQGYTSNMFFLTEMAALAKELQVVDVNMVEAFDRHNDYQSLAIPGDGHPTPVWHRLVAQEIHRALRDAGLIEKDHRGAALTTSTLD